jgi:hypothetical protein
MDTRCIRRSRVLLEIHGPATINDDPPVVFIQLPLTWHVHDLIQMYKLVEAYITCIQDTGQRRS